MVVLVPADWLRLVFGLDREAGLLVFRQMVFICMGRVSLRSEARCQCLMLKRTSAPRSEAWTWLCL